MGIRNLVTEYTLRKVCVANASAKFFVVLQEKLLVIKIKLNQKEKEKLKSVILLDFKLFS